MAITATFQADFQKWNEGLRNAQASLKSFELSTVGVKQQLQRMVSGFDGSKIIRDAQVAAAAVAQIGGAAKLTESEQRKVNATVTEAIAKYHALGDSAPKELHDLAEATKQVEKPTAAAASSVDDLVKKYVTIGAAIAIAKQAFSSLTEFVGSSIQSFAAAEAAQRKVTTALIAQGNATPAVIRDYNALASTFQRTTTFSDDLVQEMEALFIQVGNVGPSQMDKALTAATDLAAGLGIDLRSATVLVSKALEGNTGALKRYGIEIDGAKVAAEGASAVFGAINDRFGGQAEAAVDTYAGRLEQLANQWDNVKEAVGKFTVTNELSIAALNAFSEAMGKANDNAELAAPSIAGVWVAMGQSRVGALGIALLEDYVGLLNQANNGRAAFNASVAQGQVTPPPSLPQPVPLPSVANPLAELEALKKWDEEISRTKAEANAAAKALKELTEALSGKEGVDGLRRLVAAWKAAPEAIRQTTAAQDLFLDQWEKIGPKLTHVPAELSGVVKSFNALSMAAGRFSVVKVATGLKSLDGIATDVHDAFWPVYLDLLKFESDVSKIKIGDVISAAFKLDDRIETNFMNTVTDLQQRLTLVNKKGLDRQLAELQFSKTKELATIKANSQLTEEEYQKLASIVDGIYDKMAKAAIKAGSFGGKFVTSLKQGLAQAGTDLVGILTGVLTGDLKGDAIGKAIGATIGGAIGFALGGPFGAAAGAAIGQGIAEVFSTKAEQTARRVSREFGTHIGEEMGQAIVDRANEVFGGDQVAAQIFSLGDIIKAAGGLNFENVEQIGARLHDVFSEVETGAFTAAQGMEVLDDAFKAYADFVTKDGTLASKQLLELIRLNDEFGTHSAAVSEFVAGQASKALGGLSTFLEKTAVSSQTAATGIAAAIAGIATALEDAGATPLDALQQVGPLVEKLDAQLAKAGFSGGAAFASLKSDAALASDAIAGPLLSGAAALGTALEGLHNSDILDQTQFAGIVAQITATRNQLVGMGKDGDQVNRLIGSSLQTAWELEKDFGYQVDAATQKLLDEAEAAGIVGDQHRSAQQQMQQALDRTADAVEQLVVLFGGTLPNAIKKTGDAINRIPDDIKVRVHYEDSGFRSQPSGPTGGAGERPEHFATGGVVSMAAYKASKVSQYLAAGGPVHKAVGALAASALLATAMPAQAMARHAHATPAALYAATGTFVAQGTDTVPAMLTPGEYVLPTKVVQKEGVPALEALREGHATIVAYHAETKAAMPTRHTGDAGAVAGYATGGIVLPSTIGASLEAPPLTADLAITTDAAQKALEAIRQQPPILMVAQADTSGALAALAQVGQSVPSDVDISVTATADGLDAIARDVGALPTERPIDVPVTAPGLAPVLAAINALPLEKDIAATVRLFGLEGVQSGIDTVPRTHDVSFVATGLPDVKKGEAGIPDTHDLTVQYVSSGLAAILAEIAKIPRVIDVAVRYLGGQPPGTPTGPAPPLPRSSQGSAGYPIPVPPAISGGSFRAPGAGIGTSTGSGGSFHLAQGGLVPAFYAAAGRYIPRGTDTVLAGLTPGEGVLNTRAMAVVGAPLLNQWNRQPESLSRLIETSTRLDSTSATASVAPLLAPTPVTLPVQSTGAGTQPASAARSVHVTFHISALDGADVTRVLKSSETRNALRSLIVSMLAHNESEFRTDVREKAGIV